MNEEGEFLAEEFTRYRMKIEEEKNVTFGRKKRELERR